MNSQNRMEIRDIRKQFDIKCSTFYGGVGKKGIKSVLNGISFELKKGEILGLVGRNGCGKSTLLKIISGVMASDSGAIEKNGKVASILELGIGFDSELSGRDNIYLKAGLFGLGKNEVDSKIDNIIAFSEIGEQIDYPLRTYSSGMVAKLAFSILILVKSEILVIDEVLSIGDSGFNSKCNTVFNEIKKEQRSVIITSHNLTTLETLCDRVVWIDNGVVKEIGDPASVCYHYDRHFKDSIETLMDLANTGDLASINRLGILYRDGIGVECNRDVALQYFIRASELGSTEALLNIASIKLENGLKDDAIIYYKKAADLGNTGALIKYYELTEAYSVIEEFKQEVRREAENGNLRVMKLLANMLYEGSVFSKNPVEAVEWFKKCAMKNNLDAQYMLGQCYRDGIGVDTDVLASIKWFEKASYCGSIKAKLDLANIYRKGIGIEVDMEKAIFWYEKAANCGDQSAMYQLGIIYRDGKGVEPDSLKSELWFKQYSEQPLLKYEVQFADIIKQGSIGEKQKNCMKWYLDAGSKNSIGGLNNIANIYRDGSLAPPDVSKAVTLYEKTAMMGSQFGLYELAMAYLRGSGIERNLEKAFDLMKQSSDMGNLNAMVQLLYMYRDGIGTAVDLDAAREINNRLVEQGSVTGKINAPDYKQQ